MVISVVIGGDANHVYVGILILNFSVDTKVLITRGIVDFYINLLIIDLLFTPVNVENSRFVVIIEEAVHVAMD